jgi:zinc transporter
LTTRQAKGHARTESEALMQEAIVAGASADAPTENLGGLISAFRFTDSGAEELDVDKPITEQRGSWLWLHFNLADARACRLLKSDLTFPPVARDLLVATDEHQQLNASDHCLYGVLPDLVCAIDGVTEEIGFLHFAMTENMIITGRRRALSAIQVTRNALRNGANVATPAALLEAIMGYMVDSIDRFSDDFAAKLDRIEDVRDGSSSDAFAGNS